VSLSSIIHIPIMQSASVTRAGQSGRFSSRYKFQDHSVFVTSDDSCWRLCSIKCECSSKSRDKVNQSEVHGRTNLVQLDCWRHQESNRVVGHGGLQISKCPSVGFETPSLAVIGFITTSTLRHRGKISCASFLPWSKRFAQRHTLLLMRCSFSASFPSLM
jgi:hypothetical protein